jgi:stage V sporulation protein AC
MAHNKTSLMMELIKLKTNQYSKVIENHMVKPTIMKNMATAFFFGGLVSLVGQVITWININMLDLDEETAVTYMIVTMILAASLLTGLGIYDKFGQVAKAGSFVPITGFSNSLTSAALEGKSEGIFQGIALNLFKLAGSVIVFAVVSGFFFGLLRYFLVEQGIAPGLHHEVVALVGVFV